MEDVTARQAASAAVRERPSELAGFAAATPGVSHEDNVDLAVRPVSVATVLVVLLLRTDLLFGPASPAANQERAGLRTNGYAVVMAPL